MNTESDELNQCPPPPDLTNLNNYEYILHPLSHHFDPCSTKFHQKSCIDDLIATQIGSSTSHSSPTCTRTTASNNRSQSIKVETKRFGRQHFIQSTVRRCKDEKNRTKHINDTEERAASDTNASSTSTRNKNNYSEIINNCIHCRFWCHVGAKYLSKEMVSFSHHHEEQQKQKGQQQDEESSLYIHVPPKHKKLLRINGKDLNSISSSSHSTVDIKLQHGDIFSIVIPSNIINHQTNSNRDGNCQSNNENGTKLKIREYASECQTVNRSPSASEFHQMSFAILSSPIKHKINGGSLHNEGTITRTLNVTESANQETHQHISKIEKKKEESSPMGFFAALRARKKQKLQTIKQCNNNISSNNNCCENDANKKDTRSTNYSSDIAISSIKSMIEESQSEESPMLSMHHFSMMEYSDDRYNDIGDDDYDRKESSTMESKPKIGDSRTHNMDDMTSDNTSFLSDMSIAELKLIQRKIATREKQKLFHDTSNSCTSTGEGSTELYKKRFRDALLTLAIKGKEDKSRCFPPLLEKMRISKDMLEMMTCENICKN